MTSRLRDLTERPDLTRLVVAAIAIHALAVVVAVLFEFRFDETFEIVIAAAFVVGVIAIFAAVARELGLVSTYGLIVGGASLAAAAFVIALGFDFDADETLAVFVTSVLVTEALAIAAGLAWAVGKLLDALSDEPSG